MAYKVIINKAEPKHKKRSKKPEEKSDTSSSCPSESSDEGGQARQMPGRMK